MPECPFSHDVGHISIAGETAIQLLPMVDTYKMTKLRRKCAAAMLTELLSMKKPDKIGHLSTSILLKYLAAADKFNIERVRKFCIDECATNTAVTSRKDIVEDKHIIEKSKVAILDKMCDHMIAQYDKKLDSMTKERRKIDEDLAENRRKYEEEMKEWRTGFEKEVEDVIKTKSYKPLYEHLLEQNKEIRNSVDEALREVNTMKEHVLAALDPLESVDTDNIDFKTVAADIEVCKEVIETTCKDAKCNIKKMSDASKEYFNEALKNVDIGVFQTSFAGCYEIELKADDLLTEVEDKTQEACQLQVLYEREKTQHERTKAQLAKQLKKVHQINTWVKWAKPVDDDEKKCTCYRHDPSRPYQPYQA